MRMLKAVGLISVSAGLALAVVTARAAETAG